MNDRKRPVLILGSAPDVVRAKSWPREWFEAIMTLNTAFRVRPDWTHAAIASDFPVPDWPLPNRQQQVLTAAALQEAQLVFGGFQLCGETMAFTGGYLALTLFPGHPLLFLGCDMVYDSVSANGAPEATHFYGSGQADPLRPHLSLQSLPAKSARLMCKANALGSPVFNLSEKDRSNLVYPRLSEAEITQIDPQSTVLHQSMLAHSGLIAEAEALEASFGRVLRQINWPRMSFKKFMQIDLLWFCALKEGPDPAAYDVPGATVGRFERDTLQMQL
ncbi:MAG: hypothetical protein AAFQ36_12605 [Pseudomonadota bacterium]